MAAGEEAHTALMHIAARRGAYPEMLTAAGDLRTTTRLTGDPQTGCWAELAEAEAELARGDLDAAEAAMGRAAPWIDGFGRAEPTTWIWGEGLRAAIAVRRGRTGEAKERLAGVTTRLGQVPLMVYWMVGGILWGGVALYGLLAEARAAGRKDADLEANALVFAKLAKKLTGVFPFAVPMRTLLMAHAAAAAGDREKARKLWSAALREAEGAGARQVAALSHEALASVTEGDEAETHRAQARNLGVAMGLVDVEGAGAVAASA